MVSIELKHKALSAYREALRSTKIVFRKDLNLLQQSNYLIRQGLQDPTVLYDKFPNIPRDNTTEQIAHLLDVSKFLKRNIVQGSATQPVDPIEKKIQNNKDDGKTTYHLNIHKDTELGDNDSIKNMTARSTLKVGNVSGGGCCGGSGKKS